MAQIPLTGSVGVPGSAAILGGIGVSMTDANHTLLPSEYSNQFLYVTSSVSLTAVRNLVGPSNLGQTFIIENATTGGFAIQIIASSGSGIVISNGQTVQVIFDGTNYLQVSGVSNSQGSDWPALYQVMGG